MTNQKEGDEQGNPRHPKTLHGLEEVGHIKRFFPQGQGKHNYKHDDKHGQYLPAALASSEMYVIY